MRLAQLLKQLTNQYIGLSYIPGAKKKVVKLKVIWMAECPEEKSRITQPEGSRVD